MRALVLVLWAKAAFAGNTLYDKCPRTKDWEDTKRCLYDRAGSATRILYDLADAKLVALPLSDSNERIELYQLVDGLWSPASFVWTSSLTGEVIDFGMLPDGSARVAFGTASAGFQATVVKRINTAVCPKTKFMTCRSVMTSCDLLVHGRSYESFRGKLVWKAGVLKVAGDTSNA